MTFDPAGVFLLPLQVVIPLCFIHIVKKQNMALLVPNALSIRTANGDKVSLAAPQPLLARLPPWLISLVPFDRLVPVHVAAEPRELLPAAAVFMPVDRGEFHATATCPRRSR